MDLSKVISKLKSDKMGFLSLLPYFNNDFNKLKNFIQTKTSLGSDFDKELDINLVIEDHDIYETWGFDANIIGMDKFVEGGIDHISLYLNVNVDLKEEYYDVFFQWISGHLAGENFNIKFKYVDSVLKKLWINTTGDLMFLVYIKKVNGKQVDNKEKYSFKEQDKIIHPLLKKYQES
jgi:hypothetical protein